MSTPSRERLHAIATTIQGIMDNLDLLPAAELPADVALASERYQQACEALRHCDDLDTLGVLWFAAYEAGRTLAFTATRELLAERRRALEQEQARKKAKRHHS